MSSTWRVETATGTAQELHDRPFTWARTVARCEVTRPALVLGSTQQEPPPLPTGVELARRRSGGGAVLVTPGGQLWLDVDVPAGDDLWDHDVGRSFWWLGDAWARALADVGVGEAVVHRGGLERRPWSSQVCFAGLGPGEVTVGRRKVVGISQRRWREGARFHCAALLTWDPVAVVAALGLPDEAATDVAMTAMAVDPAIADDLVQAFLRYAAAPCSSSTD
ncbi:MAG TPA: hypothetical protein VM030_07270 [Acidimicrobiales bacterium]|nr:hypothetical protein [Acidimicrobiales bacterium]